MRQRLAQATNQQVLLREAERHEHDLRLSLNQLALQSAELELVVRYYEYFAGVCQALSGLTLPDAGPFFTYTRREPVGVVGAIIPWNSPLVMLAWKLAPALACGTGPRPSRRGVSGTSRRCRSASCRPAWTARSSPS